MMCQLKQGMSWGRKSNTIFFVPRRSPPLTFYFWVGLVSHVFGDVKWSWSRDWEVRDYRGFQFWKWGCPHKSLLMGWIDPNIL